MPSNFICVCHQRPFYSPHWNRIIRTWKISQGNAWLQNQFIISCAIPGAEKEQKVEVTSWSQIILYGEMCYGGQTFICKFCTTADKDQVRFDLDDSSQHWLREGEFYFRNSISLHFIVWNGENVTGCRCKHQVKLCERAVAQTLLLAFCRCTFRLCATRSCWATCAKKAVWVQNSFRTLLLIWDIYILFITFCHVVFTLYTVWLNIIAVFNI